MSWLAGFMIGLAPLILLVAALLAGRYPGEKTIERCRRAITILFVRTGGRRGPVGSTVLFPASVRGGRLIAQSMAGRAPPRPVRL
jgi:hypothetical protein